MLRVMLRAMLPGVPVMLQALLLYKVTLCCEQFCAQCNTMLRIMLRAWFCKILSALLHALFRAMMGEMLRTMLRAMLRTMLGVLCDTLCKSRPNVKQNKWLSHLRIYHADRDTEKKTAFGAFTIFIYLQIISLRKQGKRQKNTTRLRSAVYD